MFSLSLILLLVLSENSDPMKHENSIETPIDEISCQAVFSCSAYDTKFFFAVKQPRNYSLTLFILDTTTEKIWQIDDLRVKPSLGSVVHAYKEGFIIFDGIYRKVIFLDSVGNFIKQVQFGGNSSLPQGQMLSPAFPITDEQFFVNASQFSKPKLYNFSPISSSVSLISDDPPGSNLPDHDQWIPIEHGFLRYNTRTAEITLFTLDFKPQKMISRPKEKNLIRKKNFKQKYSHDVYQVRLQLPIKLNANLISFSYSPKSSRRGLLLSLSDFTTEVKGYKILGILQGKMLIFDYELGELDFRKSPLRMP